ncbi:hypothetical protein Ddye_006274 [Dipteronia dyeriana]|uniref:Uncharacterized protein n=1 Tax=Dipteronia dyeriana TaxID=168575 RepID=A0AAE0CQK4_9ROSI|nr:hypothetical protein Ddye_006274 [Dipteronia dyeriana]
MRIEEESMKSQTAIRCAQAAVLLSSLSNRNMKATINNEEDEEKEREIEDLKVELVRERMKTKKIKLCGLMEVVLEVMVVFFFSSFILMFFVFKFDLRRIAS